MQNHVTETSSGMTSSADTDSIPVIPGDRRLRPAEFITEVEKILGTLPDDFHVSRMFSSLVAISNGNVIAVSEPYMTYCPLAASLYGRDTLPDRSEVVDGIRHAVSEKVRGFGYYTGSRELCTNRIAIPFGASEMMMRARQKGEIDAAVVACEGAGTVIARDPDLVQGIGARMNGLFHTSSIPETINRIEKSGGYVVFPDTARINQRAGLERALEMGFEKIVVTVNAFQEELFSDIRKIADQAAISPVIMAICTTGIDEERATELADEADLIWSCASNEVRMICGAKARIQVTTRIPVFVMTDRGISFFAAYATRPNTLLDLDPGAQYLISRTVTGIPVTLGKVPTFISKAERLPVGSSDAPRLL